MAARPPDSLERLTQADLIGVVRELIGEVGRLRAENEKLKDALLRVLDRPEIPLNTNASENDIRTFVTKRKLSGGTVSDSGRDARDIMLGLGNERATWCTLSLCH
jgi:hypothetical protein